MGTAGGINKSTDGGVSWTKFNHINETNPISGDWVVALAYNQANSTIWAATRRADDPTEIYAACYSKDGGLNWHTTLPNETIDNFAISDGVTEQNQVIAASEEGLFRTSDNGNNWTSPGIITDINTKISLNTYTFYPSVSIVLTGFLTQAKAVAQAMGVTIIAMAEYPGIVAMDSKEELRRKVTDVLIPNIIAGFTRQVNDTKQRIDPDATRHYL